MRHLLQCRNKKAQGFTLVEVMAVVIILVIVAAIAVPRITSSVEKARENADVATGHQVKNALDRFRLENGYYPKRSQLSSNEGAVQDTAKLFIPAYISKLDTTVTQQEEGAVGKGFAVSDLGSELSVTHLIMIYLTANGTDAAVQVVKGDGTVLWFSRD